METGQEPIVLRNATCITEDEDATGMCWRPKKHRVTTPEAP